MNTVTARSCFRRLRLIGLPLALASAAFVNATTLTDPTLATGTNSIDPSGSRAITVIAPNSTPKATMEALPGFGVVQNFTGFLAGTNQIAFTDPLRSDVQISFSGTGNGTSGGELANSQYVTSGTSGVRFVSNNQVSAHTLIQTIDFGSWSGSTFDSAVNGVSAAAFTLSALASNFDRVNSISASFLSASGTVYSTQTVSGSTLKGATHGIYFGYQTSGQENIGSIVITVDVAAKLASEGQPIFGFDDFGFTSIPEPSTYAALLGAFAFGCVVLFRRR